MSVIISSQQMLSKKAEGSSGVSRSLRFLEKQWFRPINVRHVVVASKMSRRGLFKAFIRLTGERPGRYLRRIRIERAKELLRGSEWKIEEISGICGFASLNTFCIAFKREVGTSPTGYRTRNGGRASDLKSVPRVKAPKISTSSAVYPRTQKTRTLLKQNSRTSRR